MHYKLMQMNKIDEDKKLWYVYSHNRKNDDKIFYIGIGKTKRFKRSREKYGRSNMWKKTVKKYGYSINILHTELTLVEANQIEKYLVAYYGRRNLGLGYLTNLTDGGDGVQGYIPTEAQRLKMSLSNTKPTAKEVINIETLQVWTSAKECSKEHNFNYKYLQSRLSGEKINNTPFRYKGEENIEIRKHSVFKEVICLETGRRWKNVRECAKDLNLNYGFLVNKLNSKTISKNDTTLRIVGEEHIITQKIKPKLSKIINIVTGEIYESIKQCAEMNNINYKSLGKRMCGELKNNTNFRYLEKYDRTSERSNTCESN